MTDVTPPDVRSDWRLAALSPPRGEAPLTLDYRPSPGIAGERRVLPPAASSGAGSAPTIPRHGRGDRILGIAIE